MKVLLEYKTDFTGIYPIEGQLVKKDGRNYLRFNFKGSNYWHEYELNGKRKSLKFDEPRTPLELKEQVEMVCKKWLHKSGYYRSDYFQSQEINFSSLEPQYEASFTSFSSLERRYEASFTFLHSL